MSLDIHGWVEITRQDEPERSGEHAWTGVLNLSALIDVADPISERLFGLSRRAASDGNAMAGIASGRGLPAYPSKEVADDIAAIRALARQSGHDECEGFTFATWREIAAVGVSDAELRSSDWTVVFDLVRRLQEDERLGPDRIRFVVYFCV